MARRTGCVSCRVDRNRSHPLTFGTTDKTNPRRRSRSRTPRRAAFAARTPTTEPHPPARPCKWRRAQAPIQPDAARPHFRRQQRRDERLARRLADLAQTLSDEGQHQPIAARQQTEQQRKQGEKNKRQADERLQTDAARHAADWQIGEQRHRVLHGDEHAEPLQRQAAHEIHVQHDEIAHQPIAPALEYLREQKTP